MVVVLALKQQCLGLANMAGPLGYNIQIQTLDEKFGRVANPPEERTEDIVATVGEQIPTEEAKSRVSSTSGNAIYDLFIKGYQNNATAEELQSAAADLGLKNEDFRANPEFVAEQAMMAENADYSAVDARIATNYQIATEATQKRMQAIGEDKGTFGRALDATDRFLRAVSPIGVYEDVTAKTEDSSREILDRAATMAPAEFKVWFEGYLDQTAQEGIFRGETLGSFEDVLSEVGGAGYDPTKGFKQVLGAIDIATAGTTALAVRGARGAVRTVIKASTPVGRVGAVRGAEAAAKAADDLLKTAPDPVVLGNVAPSILDNLPQPVRPPQGKFAQKMAENKIAQEIDDMFQKGAFGRVATTDQIKAVSAKVVDNYKKNVAHPIYDFKTVDEGLGQYVSVTRFGKAADGTPYKPLLNGQPPRSLLNLLTDIKTRVPTAEIAPVDPNDAKKGYVIEVKERLNIEGLPEAIDETQTMLMEGGFSGMVSQAVRNTAGLVMNNSLMGSTALRDVQKINNLANMAESSRAAVKGNIVQPYVQKIGSLSAKERYTVQAVYTQLRDGPDAALRVRYTEGEFYVKYREMHPNGAAPTPKAYEAYEALAQIEEADYILKTQNVLRRYIEKGYQTSIKVRDNYFAPAKVVNRSDIPADARILDGETGAKLRIQDFDENFPIWKLDKPTRDGQEYVVAPAETRLIDPTDVMGYNPGGSRINPELNYFVVLGDKRLKALMGTFSEKQAKLAKEQLTNLKRAVGDGSLTDEVVQANNDWNPSIQTVDEFNKFAADEGWDLTRGEIGYKNRDGDILDNEVEGEGVFVGMKASDYVDNDMRRNDKVLLDFGGGRAYNEDPVNSILAQFGQSVFTYSNRAYGRHAMVGWVKKAQQMGRSWFPAGIPPNSYEELFRRANVTGNDEFARRMRELQEITMRKISMQDEFSTWMEGVGTQISEFVFDKTSLKVSVPDPTNIFLKVAFQSAFGFLNSSQFLMQGFHATTIMAISPAAGFKGAALVPAMRAALRAADKGAGDEAVKRFAKAAQISDKEAKEWFDYIRTSGRAVVEGDAIEDGTGVAFGISGWKGEDMRYSTVSSASYYTSKMVGKGLDAGLMPFKAGERLTRLTAMNTAILEWKAKFPKTSILSDQARQWITQREQTLTFNMSSLSRGKVQSGFMKVPTTWLSYTMRAMEAVLVGRDLSVAERGRLFIVLAPFYGLTGFGAASAADYIAEKMNIKPDSNWYTFVKYGAIDALVDALPGSTEIGVGGRLAPAGAIMDTYKNITEGKFLEVAFGPAGQIGGGLYTAVTNAAASLFYGQSATLTEDVIKILRTPSGVDNVAKAIGIFNNGIYRSKTGMALPYEMSVGDGIIALTGFTPLEVVEHYSRTTDLFASDKKFGEFRKEVNKDAEFIFSLLENGNVEDSEKAIRLFGELHERISFSGLSLDQQNSLRKSARTKLDSTWNKIQDNLIKNDRLYAAQAAQAILQGNNE